jgi:hypothetical protein
LHSPIREIAIYVKSSSEKFFHCAEAVGTIAMLRTTPSERDAGSEEER